MPQELTGLFIGAGASYDAGMPLVWELTTYLKSWLTPEKFRDFNRGWAIQGEGYPSEVVEDFLAAWATPELHYESVLGFLEVQSKRSRNGFSQHYYGLYSWLVQMISYKLYGDHFRNKEQILKCLDLYQGLEWLTKQNRPLWVFSLNHDSIVETVAAHFNIPVYSGFDRSKTMKFPRRTIDGTICGIVEGETISREVLDKGAMHFPNPAEKGIYLLKIHGALDMFVYNDAGDMVKMIPESQAPADVIDVLRIANEELIYAHPGAPGGIVRASNEIAYADFDGQMNFLRRTLLSGAQKFHEHGTQVLPKSMLKHFKSNLNFLDRLICIGYGFGDHHVNDSIASWLSFSDHRKLEIVGPGVAAVPASLLHLARQVELVDSGATEYLDDIAGIKRSELSNLERRLRQVQRRMGAERSHTLTEEFRVIEENRFHDLLKEKFQALVLDGRIEDAEAVAELAEQLKAEIPNSPEEMLMHLIEFLVSKTTQQLK
ncbi:hypothetical protein IFT47_04365 [Pseudomonas sp. CFBP 13711]|uniref:hypothetical protein n=1 Tax=unclassified Pseudomonas TaxID=196821 RepID=UPI001782A5B9|nr:MULTISPECIES: hypothetical protein [unclassified Pseudomonas]MBD8705863.1 hypothetical protein [Pseudomonas sp. CFBP 13711]MBD8710438.1 hypothetical protein [Pseudomonas sp. CFBP 13715]